MKAADLEAGVQRGLLHQSPGQIDGFRPFTRSAATAGTPQEAVDLLVAALGPMLDSAIPAMPAYVEVPFDLLDREAEPVPLPARARDAEPGARRGHRRRPLSSSPARGASWCGSVAAPSARGP